MTRWLALTLLALCPQDVKLEPKYASGDKATVVSESTLDVEIASKDGEGEKTRRLTVSRHEEFSQELMEVASGKPRMLRVKCTKAALQKSGTNMNPTDMTSPIEGQTYDVTFGEGTSVKTLTGDPAPAEGEMVGSWMDLVRLLPGKDVKVGDAWEVEAKNLGATLWIGNISEIGGKIQCKLESHADGKATISFKGSVTGKTNDGFESKFTVAAGSYVFDTAGGRSASYSMSGELEMTKKVVEKFRKPDSYEDEYRELGWITVKSKKLEAKVEFK